MVSHSGYFATSYANNYCAPGAICDGPGLLSLSSFERLKIFFVFLNEGGRKKYKRKPIAIHSIEYIMTLLSTEDASPKFKLVKSKHSLSVHSDCVWRNKDNSLRMAISWLKMHSQGFILAFYFFIYKNWKFNLLLIGMKSAYVINYTIPLLDKNWARNFITH